MGGFAENWNFPFVKGPLMEHIPIFGPAEQHADYVKGLVFRHITSGV